MVLNNQKNIHENLINCLLKVVHFSEYVEMVMRFVLWHANYNYKWSVVSFCKNTIVNCPVFQVTDTIRRVVLHCEGNDRQTL